MMEILYLIMKSISSKVVGMIKKKENITIYDIAKEANVSPSTVSRVLTGSARVSPQTSKRVINIIEKYNFRPNSLARSLLYKKSKTIGFILPDINHPFFSTLVFKSEAYALELGYTSFLCNSMNDIELESKYLQNLIDKQVDGIIFLGGRINKPKISSYYINEMKQVVNRIPTVFINGEMPGVDAHIVRTDEDQGVKKLVQLLINHGHKKIGFIGGLPGISSTNLKKKSFLEALHDLDIEVNEDWIIEGDFNIKSGEENLIELLKLNEQPTALICVNDFVAIGVIKKLNQLGFNVPKDFSVVGFDDIYLARHFPPGLTTVSQNYEMLGKTAVRILIDLINGKKAPKETIVPTNLVVRNSIKKFKKH